MLLILFKIGHERYAISGCHIIEILPYIIPQTLIAQPDFVPGTINYRGQHIPIIDIGTLLTNKPCRKRLSTRIILIRYTSPDTTSDHQIIGLLAEEVTDSVIVNDPYALQVTRQKHKLHSSKQYINADLVGYNMVQLFEPHIFLPALSLDNTVLR